MTTPATDLLVNEASAIIEERIGLSVRKQFQNELEAILLDVGGGDLPWLITALRQQPEHDPVWQALMRALTIGETYFFRDEATFSRLRQQILPELISQRRQQEQLELAIWSAGCATGEEAYSIAILLHELLPERTRWKIRLVASDINVQALEQAQQGIYRDWAFRHNPQHIQQTYFEPVAGGWQIRPLIRQMVRFEHGNLLTPPAASFDLILCRNVLIYFDRDAVFRLEDMLYRTLNPGGWLALGQSEALRGPRDRWLKPDAEASRWYQKPAQAATLSATPAGSAAVATPLEQSFLAARQALHHKQISTAEAILRDLLAQNPRHTRAHTLLASLLAGRGQLSTAHTHLDHALRVDSLLADAHYLRAMLFMEEEQHDLAWQALRSALYCQRDHLLAAFMTGTIYAKSGDTSRALREWEKARQAADQLPPDAAISDLSDMTAASFSLLVSSQIKSLHYA
jgi:chemotaxis protein methyltransferase CheR